MVNDVRVDDEMPTSLTRVSVPANTGVLKKAAITTRAPATTATKIKALITIAPKTKAQTATSAKKKNPTCALTLAPSLVPTLVPTLLPTLAPTLTPTLAPTICATRFSPSIVTQPPYLFPLVKQFPLLSWMI